MVITFALLFCLFAAIGNAAEELTVSVAIGMFAAAGLAHLWIALAIRCGNCHRRVGWMVMMMAGKNWLAQLWRGETCPSCGDPGRSAAP